MTSPRKGQKQRCVLIGPTVILHLQMCVFPDYYISVLL